ncbi:DUF6894 family protein [Aurantimonas endophytica]|uniref:DUF6894 domain-containing protein n=1 Tax=Aurantimonas endophytica TaxID=1522175 RepID=A0A7W6MMN6_9HYPH|nr:hypothetical protein [Aurantimonas endophytica]MBB4000994.1 hypothetical protein [Aurantimonas endophytica]MCO6403349.1 hypothetical protein [Aurantimonas endophytica]
MARFFFNLHDGIDVLDTVGSEHADMASVRGEAVEFLAERVRGNLLRGKDTAAWLLKVTDESRKTVLTVSFSAALQVTGEGVGA